MCRQLPTFFALSLCLPLSHTHTHIVWEDGCVWLHVYLRASVCGCVCVPPYGWWLCIVEWVLLWLQFCIRSTVAVRSFVQLGIGVIHHNIIGHQLAHSTQPSPFTIINVTIARSFLWLCACALSLSVKFVRIQLTVVLFLWDKIRRTGWILVVPFAERCNVVRKRSAFGNAVDLENHCQH